MPTTRRNVNATLEKELALIYDYFSQPIYFSKSAAGNIRTDRGIRCWPPDHIVILNPDPETNIYRAAGAEKCARLRQIEFFSWEGAETYLATRGKEKYEFVSADPMPLKLKPGSGCVQRFWIQQKEERFGS